MDVETPTENPRRYAPAPPLRGAALLVIVCAWTIPLLIVGQFAWLATVPVALVLAGTLASHRLRALRWPAAGLAAAYALPYVIWKTRTDPATSLSRDIHPALAVLVVAAAAGVILAFHLTRRGADHAERSSHS